MGSNFINHKFYSELHIQLDCLIGITLSTKKFNQYHNISINFCKIDIFSNFNDTFDIFYYDLFFKPYFMNF